MSERRQPTTSSTVELPTEQLTRSAEARAARRSAYLVIAHRDGVAAIPLVAGSSVVVGREAPADVAIMDKSLSRRHARFTLAAAEEVAVEDLGSTNGTRVAGKRVERAIVRPGDEVRLGSVAVSLHVIAGGDARALDLDAHEGFRGAVEAELLRARCFGRPCAVIAARALGEDAPPVVAWAPRVRQLVRSVDRVALYGAGVVEVLLAEADRDRALAVARSIADLQGASLACGVALFPSAASSEELLEESLSALRRATSEQPVIAASSEAHRTLRAGEPAIAAGGEIVLESPAMREIARLAARLADAVIPVLIHGETGTGKEVITRIIHENGPRRDRALVAVNCAAIPAELVESTLFGHERGAFTGAAQQQKGLFESADGGTILLDEVGELPPAAQAALLRVLEERRVRRVGAAREIELDVRVVAATHRDLEAMADAGSFRRDLLYRLNAMVLTLPPLRARKADIAPLAARFLAKAAKANRRDVRAIAPDALALLDRYAWPGNVRELRNAIERAVVIAEGDTVTALDLPERVRAAAPKTAEAAPAPRAVGSLKARMERFERETILDMLREVNENQSEAARRLEVPLRTLQHKISALGIKRTLGHRGDDPAE